jgi:hypothetical protein
VADLDALRAGLWRRLKDEYALFAPKGSLATPAGSDGPVGRPVQTRARGRQFLPVAAEIDRRVQVGQQATVVQRQLNMGLMATPRAVDGLSRIWVDATEKMPISAVPPQIRKSLYQPFNHNVGLWPMNDKWYPIAMKANTMNDVRWRVTQPPKAGPGNVPRAVSMSPRYQFRRAWRVPRYSTQPDVAVPRSGPIPPGGGNAPR